eukprot:6096231-Pyramimonas_sp.AAC.1
MHLLLLLRRSRGEALALDTLCGLRSMVGGGEALLLEFFLQARGAALLAALLPARRHFPQQGRR